MRAIILAALLVAFLASSAHAATNYNRAQLSWQHVPDTWTKYFRADCGPSSGNYNRFNRTTGMAKTLPIALILPRETGTYYCIVRGANDSDPNDPLSDATNETVFKIEGNWVYPQ